MEGKRREHRPPVPLATLEMQKRVTRELRLPGERVMKLAEELYQAGFISYPRTETDRFSNDYDLKVTRSCTCIALALSHEGASGCMSNAVFAAHAERSPVTDLPSRSVSAKAWCPHSLGLELLLAHSVLRLLFVGCL